MVEFSLKKTESAKKFLFVVCIIVAFAMAIVDPPTCPASDIVGKCSDEWEGEFFPGFPNIKYELWLLSVSTFFILWGPSTKNPRAFKWYNPKEVILGKKMKDWMRFSVAFRHADRFGSFSKGKSLKNTHSDIFSCKV